MALTEDVEAWRATLEPVFLRWAERGTFSLERYQRILELLQAYRAGLAETP